MKNPEITKDCFVNVSGWTDKEVLEAAKVFAENVEGAFIGYDDSCWLDQDQEGYDYLMLLTPGEVFVGSNLDLKWHRRFKELTKEDFFGETSENNCHGIHITFNPDDLKALENLFDILEETIDFEDTDANEEDAEDMEDTNTLENTIDAAKHFYDMYQMTTEEIENLQQRAAYYKANYEDSVEQLQGMLGEGFEVKPVELGEGLQRDAEAAVKAGQVWAFIGNPHAVDDLTFDRGYTVISVDDVEVTFKDDVNETQHWDIGEFLDKFKKSFYGKARIR